MFEELADNHLEFAGLAEIKKTLGLLHEFHLTCGSDNRCRTPIWAFSTITARMAPDGSAYPFTTAAWTRYPITPTAGTALAYLDFASMEFGVAAGLSRCPQMTRDYAEGDPYVAFGARAGVGEISRTRLKPAVLACQYGLAAERASRVLAISRAAAQHFIDLHRRDYARYWSWSDGRLDRAFQDGILTTRDGWQCRVSSRTSERTARNWLIQANSAGIFRMAGLMAQKIGIRIVALVVVLAHHPPGLTRKVIWKS